MTNQLSLLIGTFLLFLAVGCSKNYSLTGTITFSDDGSPVPDVAVFFTDGKNVSQGAADKTGKYVVGTLGVKDGIPPGTYKVYIVGAEEIEYEPGPGGISVTKITPYIQRKYYSAETSGLTFVSDGKTKSFDITLDRYEK